jgi:hypothetical protein
VTTLGRHGADESLALALARGQTLTEAACAAGVSERTAHRRWAEPAFRRRVSDLRGEVVALAASRLATAMARAADRLAELVESTDPRVALMAAKAVLSLGLLAREKMDSETLLRELEAKLELIESQRQGDAPW